MIKALGFLCFMVCIYGAVSQCSEGFTKTHKGGYTTDYCYRYDGGTKQFATAVSTCEQKWGKNLIMPKDGNGLDDLYKLYKAYSGYYVWVGATATSQDPFNFKYLDGTPVPSYMWCKGYPTGGTDLCAYYTTTVVIGRERCIKSGSCFEFIFDHSIICEDK